VARRSLDAPSPGKKSRSCHLGRTCEGAAQGAPAAPGSPVLSPKKHLRGVAASSLSRQKTPLTAPTPFPENTEADAKPTRRAGRKRCSLLPTRQAAGTHAASLLADRERAESGAHGPAAVQISAAGLL